MRLCFIIEEKYRCESMPLVVAEQVRRWGHDVDLLEPQATITRLSDLATRAYDAYVLKTIADGPGQTILEAAQAIGIPTINRASAVRLTRDKAVATAYAHARGLPVPPTYFVAHPRLLGLIPAEEYPLVIKPTNGSSMRDIHLVRSPADLAAVPLGDAAYPYFLAQRYVDNGGFDVKLYVTGTRVDAVRRQSPLHPSVSVDEGPIPVTAALRRLALDVGALFGLDIYGVDVVETSDGWVGIDINDFPSYRMVPGAVERIARCILYVAAQARTRCDAWRSPARRGGTPQVTTRWRSAPLQDAPRAAAASAEAQDLRVRTLPTQDALARHLRGGGAWARQVWGQQAVRIVGRQPTATVASDGRLAGVGGEVVGPGGDTQTSGLQPSAR